MRHYLLLLILFLFVGCGYKPIKQYTHSLFSNGVFIQVEPYMYDPQNSVAIKEAVSEALKDRLGVSLNPRAKTKVFIRIMRVNFIPLEYDQNGYVIYYRSVVSLSFEIKEQSKSRTIRTTGFYDFPIEPNSVINDKMRYIAIKEGARKAIDTFISRLSLVR